MLDTADVLAAVDRIAGVAHQTPVLTSRTLDELVGATVFLKAESFQRTGSFKFRGAYNHVSALDAEVRSRGVIAASSGNHAQGLALAAQLHEIPVVIVMPEDAPVAKLTATAGYGAEVITYDRYTGDRDAICGALADERGLTIVPPFDHPLTMAGQGTLALELAAEVAGLDSFIACVGGGGLLAGCATALRHASPTTKIYGAEPTVGDDTKRSLDAGTRRTIDFPHTIADGQQITTPGELTFEVNRRLVDDIVLADDDQIVSTMRLLFDRLRIVIEPSGACALAALIANRDRFAGQRIGVTLSGGNIDLPRFTTLLAATEQ